jgi:hypothetical protein
MEKEAVPEAVYALTRFYLNRVRVINDARMEEAMKIIDCSENYIVKVENGNESSRTRTADNNK